MADVTLYHLRINPITGNAYMADQGSSPAMPQYVLATDYEALRKRCEAVEAALQKVADWELPETGETWPSGGAMSYQAMWGSNGVRDYFRNLARQAIAAAQEPSHG